MKNKRGFISMTLVYSFLTLFLFIMAAIMLSQREKTNYINYINDKVDEDMENFKGKSSTLMKRMLEDNTVTDGSMFSIGQIANNAIGNGNGLYYIDGGTGDNVKTDENNDKVGSRIYFFRGQVNNNNVLISKISAGGTKKYCFKIIRTNENSSIRMMFVGETTSNQCNVTNSGLSSKYDLYDNDNAFVGYMHGKAEKLLTGAPASITNGYIFQNRLTANPPTLLPGEAVDSYKHSRYEDTHNFYTHDLDMIAADSTPKYFFKHNYTLEYNDNESEIKKIVDKWYSENLASMGNMMSDAYYCNDRSIGFVNLENYDNNGYSDIATTYGNGLSYSFKCKNEQDRFSLSIYNGGYNTAINSLIYPVGLPTASDIAFAGGAKFEDNNNYYLNMNRSYWTMTPEAFNTTARVLYVNASGKILGDTPTESKSVFPVISIRPDMIVKTGKGTSADPYVIEVSVQE